MNRLLVVVDMQNDFIDGSLGTPEAQAIVPNMVKKIKNWDGDVVFTKDTHDKYYLLTEEGKNLPIEHCIRGTRGADINEDIQRLIPEEELYCYNKTTFGAPLLAENIADDDYYDYVELVGLCTDICVVSNALLIKAFAPEIEIAVDASCCAGTTPAKHEAALDIMESCQIKIINRR